MTSGFHNAEPRSREERLAAQSREKLEKKLLQVRGAAPRGSVADGERDERGRQRGGGCRGARDRRRSACARERVCAETGAARPDCACAPECAPRAGHGWLALQQRLARRACRAANSARQPGRRCLCAALATRAACPPPPTPASLPIHAPSDAPRLLPQVRRGRQPHGAAACEPHVRGRGQPLQARPRGRDAPAEARGVAAAAGAAAAGMASVRPSVCSRRGVCSVCRRRGGARPALHALGRRAARPHARARAAVRAAQRPPAATGLAPPSTQTAPPQPTYSRIAAGDF